MNTRNTLLSVFICFCLLFATGCKKELNNFSFSYSIESVGNYKAIISFDQTKAYSIEEHNYYMDNFARKQEPIIVPGTLNDADFATLKRLLEACNLPDMKDTYGFENETDDELGAIMYQVFFSADGKEKYITIRKAEGTQFPEPFIQLINFLDDFVAKHRKTA